MNDLINTDKILITEHRSYSEQTTNRLQDLESNASTITTEMEHLSTKKLNDVVTNLLSNETHLNNSIQWQAETIMTTGDLADRLNVKSPWQPRVTPQPETTNPCHNAMNYANTKHQATVEFESSTGTNQIYSNTIFEAPMLKKSTISEVETM